MNPEEALQVQEIEQAESHRGWPLRCLWNAFEPHANRVLVVATVLANVGLLIFNYKLEKDTHAALIESHNAAQAHILPNFVSATDNGPNMEISLTTTGLVYNIRSWCIGVTDDAPSPIRFSLSDISPGKNEIPQLGPGQQLSVKIRACGIAGSPVSSSHPFVRVLVYSIYRQLDGTPKESVIVLQCTFEGERSLGQKTDMGECLSSCRDRPRNLPEFCPSLRLMLWAA